jgi:hypothetical protein
MDWTDAVAFPFLMDQPVARRIGEILAERFERSSNDKLCRAEKLARLIFPSASKAELLRAREFRRPSSCRFRENRFA